MGKSLYVEYTIYVIQLYELMNNKSKSTKTTLEVCGGMIPNGDEFEKTVEEVESKVARYRELNPGMTITWSMKVE